VTARLGASLLSVLAVAIPAAAQEEGDPVAGQELATQLCTACHIVGTERVGSDVAPPFSLIARDPDVSLTQLHGWVGPAHPVLPNLALTSQQIADINAYL
jgi:mono/diheme cytochrome c family protein